MGRWRRLEDSASDESEHRLGLLRRLFRKKSYTLATVSRSTSAPIHSKDPMRNGMRQKRRRNFIFLLLVAMPITSLPDDRLVAQDLDAMRAVEDRLLERRLASYDEAYDREEAAKVKLSQATVKLHTALGNREIPVAELRRMEAELSLANEEVLLRAKETAQLRSEIYNQMERLAELDRELGLGGTITGNWSIDFGEDDGKGNVIFRSSATRIGGTYTLDSGRRGTLGGSLIGTRVELELIDSLDGADRKLIGTLSDDGNQLRGSWQTHELASGRRTQGGWIAQRLGRAPPSD